jgi:beta-lactamase regulating signal transducer with metallopeptidase domain
MMAPGLQILAQTFTGRLFNTAVESVILTVLVWGVLRVMGRSNSGTRFAIWFAALAAVVALPFIAASSTQHPTSLVAANREIILSPSWAVYIFCAWAVVASLALFRVVYGLWRVRQIRRSCVEIDPARLAPAIAEIIRDFNNHVFNNRKTNSHRQVKLCLSGEVTVPAALGFFRPAIVFPTQLWPQLSPDEIQVILLHELAHLRRRDDWTNLLQKIVKAIFFFHPTVWWIENRLTIEREMACDDTVLAQTASPRAYASSLISFAEKLNSARTLALAQFLVSRMRQMSARIAQILDPKRAPQNNSWKPVTAASLALLAISAGAAAYTPQFVAFKNSNPTQRAADFSIIGASSSSAIQSSLESTLEQRAHAIPATFDPRNPGSPRHQFPAQTVSAVVRRKPPARHARALRASLQLPYVQAKLPRRETALDQGSATHATYVILQTRQYDASGAGVWTLCIWKIEGGDSAAQEFQSAIVLSVI